MRNNKGFTLIELIVVMAIFITVIIISSYAFETIIGKSGQQMKSAETGMEGIIGLELFRRDVETAGYGLPWSFENTPDKYMEVDVADDWLMKGISSNSFNDVVNYMSDMTPVPPRAIIVGTTTTTGSIIAGTSNTNPGVDYLVIKSVLVGLNNASRRWNFVNYSGSPTTNTNNSYLKKVNTTEDLQDNDRVITLISSYSDDTKQRQLAMNGVLFFYAKSGSQPTNDAFKPASATIKMPENIKINNELVVAYGVTSSNDLRMPFNRADYYVKKPSDSPMPTSCNPGTGILYKSVANQGTCASCTGYTHYPLLDCVGDMQVTFELDTSGSANKGYVSNQSNLAGLTAQDIREQLRIVRVYILTHEGKKDVSFQYPVPDQNSAIVVGDSNSPSTGRVYTANDMAATFGADWKNYRWKVYTIAVKPNNLNQ